MFQKNKLDHESDLRDKNVQNTLQIIRSSIERIENGRRLLEGEMVDGFYFLSFDADCHGSDSEAIVSIRKPDVSPHDNDMEIMVEWPCFMRAGVFPSICDGPSSSFKAIDVRRIRSFFFIVFDNPMGKDDFTSFLSLAREMKDWR